MASIKDEFIKKMKSELDDLNYRWSRERDRLEAMAQHEGADAKKKFEKKRDEYRKFRDEMKDKISDLEQAGDNAWDDVKEGAEQTWKTLTQTFTKATSHFKKKKEDD